MKRPERFATGRHVDTHVAPSLLKPENFRYHPEVYSLNHKNKPVVMWSDGAVHYDGYQAGVNDGLRSSSLSARTDMKANYRRYATQEDWVAAGNEIPK